jgi:hypothetical protein
MMNIPRREGSRLSEAKSRSISRGILTNPNEGILIRDVRILKEILVSGSPPIFIPIFIVLIDSSGFYI